MSDDPVRVALRAAGTAIAATECGVDARKVCVSTQADCICRHHAAAAIAAFLRALPDVDQRGHQLLDPHTLARAVVLAAAVEKAARDA